MKANAYIYGASGRIGHAFEQHLKSMDIQTDTEAEDADVIGLCVPSVVGSTLLGELTESNALIVDFSGASKRANIGSYGLLNESGELWLPTQNPHETIFGNPGCIASAVIKGIEAAGILESLAGDLQVTAVGGQSYIYQGAPAGSIRKGNRTLDHPHVAEIEEALEAKDITVTHFSTIISDQIPHGLVVTISGKLKPGSDIVGQGDPVVNADTVLGTDRLNYNLAQHQVDNKDYFTLSVAIDNIEYVASSAAKLIDLVLNSEDAAP